MPQAAIGRGPNRTCTRRMTMSRFLVLTLLAVLGAGCVYPLHPDVWSLARTDANNKDVYLGGHLTLEACQRAGVDWFLDGHENTGVLQCRLNCRHVRPDDPVVCEAAEP